MMAEPVFYPKARLPQQDDVSRKARIIDAPTPHDTIKNAQHLMPSPPMNVQPTIKRRGLTILSLPIELVTQIVDELERHVVWKDSSPVHSKPCIEGVCSVRSVHSQLRDSAWPLFARVLSTTDFSLTLGHLSCLVAIVAHPEIPKHMRTLRLSKTSMECRGSASRSRTWYRCWIMSHNQEAGQPTVTQPTSRAANGSGNKGEGHF